MLYILILIIPLLLYSIFAAAILYHLKKYAFPGDATPNKIKTAFIVVSVALAVFAAVSYFKIPWKNLNLSDQIQNLFNSSSGINIK